MSSSSLAKFAVMASHGLQWCSDVIVMGISAYFINKYEKGQHTKFDIIISTIGVVFHLPGLVSPFISALSWIALPMDIIWSYLYLTGFIFAAQDYNLHDCKVNGPPGASCSKKRGMESFLFLGFFFSLVGAIAEAFKAYQQKDTVPPVHNKETAV
ncbi:hypothetical protein KEM52_001173 [Ascosphaera acerosa]|nr:hypothetical protein KEM52_001173 [Ascosphaera acerosa]